MSEDIREGRWLQLRGRIKRTWAGLIGDDALAAEGNADVAVGALAESYGVAKKRTLRNVTRRIDALARLVKRTARSIAK